MKKPLPCRLNGALEASDFLERQNPTSISGLTIRRHEFRRESVRYATWQMCNLRDNTLAVNRTKLCAISNHRINKFRPPNFSLCRFGITITMIAAKLLETVKMKSE